MQFLISKSNLCNWKSFRRGVKQRKPTTTRKTRVIWDFKEIWVQPDPYFSFTNDPYDISSFFAVFCKISWFFGNTNLLQLPKSYRFSFVVWVKNSNLSKPKNGSRDILWRYKIVFHSFAQFGISFFQIFLFLLAFDSKDMLRVSYIAVANWQ